MKQARSFQKVQESPTRYIYLYTGIRKLWYYIFYFGDFVNIYFAKDVWVAESEVYGRKFIGEDVDYHKLRMACEDWQANVLMQIEDEKDEPERKDRKMD